MNLSCDALAALPSSGFFFVEDEVDDDEDDVDEQIGAIKTYMDMYIDGIDIFVHCTNDISAGENWCLCVCVIFLWICDAQQFAKV